MSTNMESFQALLEGMRNDFLIELPERCDSFDALILALEQSGGERETFNELYRGVHSLKGSGGTHGLHIITTLCHQLESLLSECDQLQRFDEAFATHALAYVDLLRQIATTARQERPDYAAVEAQLNKLRHAILQSRKAVLIAESSVMMVKVYQMALEPLPLQITIEANGLTALERLLHEPFDLVIIGRELIALNGIALMAALRSSLVRNRDIPALLISSNPDNVPPYARFSQIILRDQLLPQNLLTAIEGLLPT